MITERLRYKSSCNLLLSIVTCRDYSLTIKRLGQDTVCFSDSMSCCVPQDEPTELAVLYGEDQTKINSTNITNGMNNVRVQATIDSDGVYFCVLDSAGGGGMRNMPCALLFQYSPHSQRETQRGVFSIQCAQVELNGNVETCEVIITM